MSNFVVSARKYRPMRFDEIVGQEHISQTLKNAFKSNHLAHAFLFCGPRGVGKTTSARILAKVLNCENVTEDFEPCNTCSSCHSFNGNASFNITELDAASNNSVEHIRALIEQVRFQPQQGRFKIYIIDEVHMLSQQAFNAFLKTLEEPPSYAKFILATTEKHKIIPTILSRCQIFDFNRIQIPEMVAHLESICVEEGITAEKDALHIIAQKADGALRDSLSIFDRIVSATNKSVTYSDVIRNLNVLDYDYFFKLLDNMFTENVGQVMLIFDDILQKGFDSSVFINSFAEHIRNILVSKDRQTLQLLDVGESLKERYQAQAQIAPMSFLLAALNLANDCDVNYKMARNKRLHVEMSLIKMTYLNRAVNAAKNHLAVANSQLLEKKNTSDSSLTNEAAPIYRTTQNANGQTPAVSLEKPKTILKSTDTVSFSASLLSIEADIEKEEAEKANVPKIPVTLEKVNAFWQEYAELVSSTSVKAAFSSATLSLEDNEIIVKAAGSFNKSSIESERIKVFNFFKQKFKNQDLLLTIVLDEVLAAQQAQKVETKRPMTDREKFMKMGEANKLIYDLRKRFDLRPDN
jgi:DNA polymerase III subunit gamma/tau